MKITKVNIEKFRGFQEVTLGATTSYYDWQANSAGQDNIGKLLLAILSFRRLKEKHPEDYISLMIYLVNFRLCFIHH